MFLAKKKKGGKKEKKIYFKARDRLRVKGEEEKKKKQPAVVDHAPSIQLGCVSFWNMTAFPGNLWIFQFRMVGGKNLDLFGVEDGMRLLCRQRIFFPCPEEEKRKLFSGKRKNNNKKKKEALKSPAVRSVGNNLRNEMGCSRGSDRLPSKWS